MHQWTGSSLVQVMACRLFGTMPLAEPILIIVHWARRKELQWHSNENTKLSFIKMHLKLSSAKWRPYCTEWDELRHIFYISSEPLLHWSSEGFLLGGTPTSASKNRFWWIHQRTLRRKHVAWENSIVKILTPGAFTALDDNINVFFLLQRITSLVEW